MSDLVENIVGLLDQTTEFGEGVLSQTVAPVAGIISSENSDSDGTEASSTDTISTATISSSEELEVEVNDRISPAFGSLRSLTGNESPLASHLRSEGDSVYESIAPPLSSLYEAIDGYDPIHYTWDNGRRCHSYRREESPYFLPNDKAEQKRMNRLHRIWKLALNNKLCAAPIESPRRILDVGTGTGIWAIEFADRYLNTRVIGIDLSPIQPTSVPPNLQFEMGDCSDVWDFDSKFDFIFIRDALLWVRNWRKFLRQAYDTMEPGALIELQNVHFPWRSEQSNLEDSDPEQHSHCLVAGAKELGIDLCANENLEQWLKQAGFINYKEESFALCTSYTGDNTAEQRLSKLTLSNLLNGLDAYSKGFMVHGLGLSPEKVELSLDKVRRRLRSKQSPVWISASVCYAQKPVLEVSTCDQRQPVLSPSPSFESTKRPEFLDCPLDECYRKGQNGFTKRAHLSDHLSGYHGTGSLCCQHGDCTDSSGRSNRIFRRKADLARHYKSTHHKVFLDCPKRKCNRKGLNGFTRRDHLVEHQRGYHLQKIQKRAQKSRTKPCNNIVESETEVSDEDGSGSGNDTERIPSPEMDEIVAAILKSDQSKE